MKKERDPLFDILKGAAIIMVCITHFSWEPSQRIDLLFPFWVSMAVPIFMIVNGYLTAASYERRSYGLREMYGVRNVCSKLRQYLVPFTLLFLAELLFEFFLHRGLPPPPDLALAYVTGGLGKYGTYYVPVLVQMLLLFPLIFSVIRKSRGGIVLCFLANLGYELLRADLGITAYSYRLLAFRYIFLIAMGCWLYFQKGRFRFGVYLPMLLVGAAYIFLMSYTAHDPVIFTRWKTTSMITAFYMVPLIALLLRRHRPLHCPLLEQIGKASYHIFLVQILYYNYIKQLIPLENGWPKMLLGVALCLALGYGYYLLYQKGRSFLKARL